ncbi:hypothetical protein M409DRAFT_29618 [Zasmidium cellare ATCC 36951]|uniref:Uncharacterized protein n=1 Tax=Zasmidium cellare ATCC 36951 TaxID=1080233 RepID=A0A6A6C163_ZASCE|nr:uncharacterized protein M409DRAFT_29618 [Zasmidium cellare ATCC 36951]KAF2160008.1 hypothetical protein M409DRAFT_29618 [Zasmidium cellare ATCC 36951]
MRIEAILLGALAGLAMAAPQHGISDALSSVTVTAVASSPSEAPETSSSSPPTDDHVHTLPTSYKLDPQGFVHMADDGVLRSYAANGSILDALPFSNTQIKRMIDDSPAHTAPMREHLLSTFDSISGHVVHPDHHLNPPREVLHSEFGGPSPYEDDEMYAEMDRLYKKSVNELEKVKRTLEARTLYCIGKECNSTESCGILGCVVCMHWDRASSRKRYCFYEAVNGLYWNHGSGL